jgi:hypothetical protein
VLLGGFRVCDSEQVQQGGPSELRVVHFWYCYLGECIEIKLRGAARESGSVVDAFTSKYGVYSSGKLSSSFYFLPDDICSFATCRGL